VSGISSSNAASIFSTGPSAFAGPDLVHRLQVWSDESGPVTCAVSGIEKGHLGGKFVNINAEAHDLWRAVDHQDEILES